MNSSSAPHKAKHGRPLRQRPEMVSQRLLVLKFVRDYIGQWGYSPSYGEIAAALDTNRTRIKRAIRSLERDQLLLRTPGPRGLALPNDEQAALRQLRSLGWQIDEKGQFVSVGPDGTKRTLLPPPELDYRPDEVAGDKIDGAAEHKSG